MTKLTFSVQAALSKQEHEHLRIIGDIPELGRWSPFHCIELKPSCDQSACKTWSVEIDVPGADNRKYCYRYLVCQNLKGKISNVPRIIKCGPLKESQGFTNHINDGLLQVDDLTWVDGWLLHDTEVHLTIHNASRFPIGLLHDCNSASPSGGYRVKISPVSLDKNQGCLSGESFSDTVIKVAGECYSSVCNQEEMGISYDPSKHYSFVTRVLDVERVIFKVQVYTASEENECKVLGCGFIQPINLKGSRGVVDVCICNNETSMGFVQVEYLLIKPLIEKSLHNMSDLCDRNWQKQTRTLEMGHRGCGMTFSTSSDGVQENTLESFVAAYDKGADGLELDVHVTKDLELVIYHDLDVKAVLQTRNGSKLPRMVPVHQLTSEELQQIQVEYTNSSEMNDKLQRYDDPNCKTFVTLKEVLTSLPVDFPMELEVKYIETEKDKEDDPFIDVNLYVDCILDTLLKNIGNRKVVLMSFSPVIVQLMSRKQKKVPVKIAVCGETDKYPVYKDIRIRTVRRTVGFAHCERILGVSCFCDHVLADPGIVDELKKRNLILSTWGEENNTQSGREKQREMGVNVLCYDRIHEVKNLR